MTTKEKLTYTTIVALSIVLATAFCAFIYQLVIDVGRALGV